MIPIIINFVFLVSGFIFSINHVGEIVEKIVSDPHFWYQYVLYYILYVVTFLSLFLIILFVVLTAANLLAFPFNSLLAEKAIHIHKQSPKERARWIKKTWSNLGALLRRTLIFLIVGGVLILATLIPGLGVIGAAIGIFLLAYDRLDYGFDHYGLTFEARKKFVREHFLEVLGFAVGLGLTSSIPVVNILAQPGGVVAGSLLVVKLTGRDPLLERPHSQTPG
jgi:CysZ protein